ncbi:MAG: AraC family transcriptional regulator [Erysipelotrichaceae bacterium]|nr:AraC family transcriptional regulator [Erysipelotrichaceae bacterium]
MNFLFNNLNTNPYISVYTVGYEKTNPRHSYGPARRSGYMLHYIYSGKGQFTCQGKTHQLKAGDFFFISPHATITYTADDKDPWIYYWFGFRGDLVEHYLKNTSISINNPIFSLNNSTERIKSAMSRLIEISLISEHNDMLLNSCLLEILYQLSQSFPKKAPLQQRVSQNLLLAKALAYLEHNYGQNIKIGTLATLLNIDRSYLHRLFIEQLEVSPKQFLTNIRLEKAKQLLLDSDLSIRNIAYSVGFDDASNFSKLFKQETGMTANSYRKKAKRISSTP